MIAYVDIEVHAENPQMPIGPCVAFVGSPSNVRILKVPKGIGSWRIDAVAVAFTRPDNSITTVSAVNVAGCWVATLPASDVSGRCDKGFQIEASGIDENGNAVTGYVLGVGDVVILPRDGTAVSDGVQYYFHYRDAVPATPRKGDTCLIDGTLKWYDGTAWQVFAAGADIDVVPPSTDPDDAGKAADAKATGDALAGKRDKDDLALYTKVGVGETWTLVGNGGITTIATGTFDSGIETWVFTRDGYTIGTSSSGKTADAFETDWAGDPEFGASGTATRPFAYQPVTGDTLVKTSQVPTTPADIGAATAAQGAKADTAVQPAALAGAVRYDLPANATVINAASSEVVEGETVTYGAATLADRTANRVAITAEIAELRLTFPAAVSGKVRDFGLRVEVGTGFAALTAPALVLPAGVTPENPDAAIPALADGAADAKGVTLLYFSETAPGKFLVKGEEVKEVA